MATLKTKTKAKSKAIDGALMLARNIAHFPAAQLCLDYDAEADVLYISFQRPEKATETIEDNDEGILLRYRGKKLVGITVLDASTRGDEDQR